MRPLLSSRQSLALDAHTRHILDYPDEMLMEIAAGKLYEALKQKILSGLEARSPTLAANAGSGSSSSEISIMAVCGKGDNAGDALALLRHAVLGGYRRCVAYIPAGLELKDGARKNLARARCCGVEIRTYGESGQGADLGGAAPMSSELAKCDVVLDAVLGTGTNGPANALAALAIEAVVSVADERTRRGAERPLIVAIDIPSGLSDGWNPGDPIVRADATLSVEPAKQALFHYAARPYAGTVIPVGGIFPAEAHFPGEARITPSVYLVEASEAERYLPPVSAWAHKMERGRLAILAGSAAGAGAALHCVRGALAAGAGYVALFCDESLFSSMLSTLGDTAIVRAYSATDFAPDQWDAIVAGPGWGTDAARRAILARLLGSTVPMVLDADAVRLYADIAASRLKRGEAAAEGVVALTPHPGEFRDLSPLLSLDLGTDIDRGQSGEDRDAAAGAAELVPQTLSLARRLGAIIALRASTTHIASPLGECAIFDGSASGLGIAGSGDILSGLAGGLLARRLASARAASEHAQRGERPRDGAPRLEQDVFMAIAGAVVVHGLAGARLSRERGWFTPGELARECATITSRRKEENGRCGP